MEVSIGTSSLPNYRLLQVSDVRKYLGRFDQNILLDEIRPCLELAVVCAHFVMHYYGTWSQSRLAWFPE